MAINTNPTFKTGQKLTPEQLKALLALRDNGSQYGETTGDAGGQRYDINQWSMPGKFGATVSRDPQTGKTLIYQPRNVSTWGGNDTADVWDEQGNYVGTSSGEGELGGLLRHVVIPAIGGAVASQYAGAASASGGADAATSAAWANGAGRGLDTVSAVGGGAGGTAGGLGAGTLSTESLGAIDGLSLAKVGTALGGSIVGADALTNPVDTSRFDQLFDNLLAEQGKASARGDSEWQSYLDTWKPIQGLFADRVTNYDTAGRREMAAQNATGEVATQFDQQRVAAAKQMQAAGVDPSTIAALDASSRIDEAKAQAGAANKARTDVETTGLALLGKGAEFGRGLATSATQQSGVVTGTTAAANNVLNTQGNLQNQNTQNRNEMVGDLFGTVAGLYGMYSKNSGLATATGG